MRFLLKAGDLIRVRRAALRELRSGDVIVVLDWRPGPPEYVVHRLLGRFYWRGDFYAVTKGDANLLPDPLSPASAVVGVVDAVLARGTWRVLEPAARVPGLGLAVLGAPVYRGVFEADRLGWTRVPRPARRALRKLLPAYVRAIQRVYDRLQEFCADIILGREIAAPPTIREARPIFGIIEDQTWTGRIQIDGDVFVPSGVTLRIGPGAEIVFRDESQWDCLRELRLWKDPSKKIEGKCRLLIAGRVLAEGTKEAPISFGGADWGGMHFVADSWGSALSRVSIRRSLDAAVTVHDCAQATLEFADISDCGSGIEVRGAGAKAELGDCRLERCARRGISVADGALSARRSVVADCTEAGVFAADAELELQDVRLEGSPVGLSQSGGRARLIRVNAVRAKNVGFELDRGEFAVTDSVATDCGDAVRSGGGVLRLRNFEAAACVSGVFQRSGKLDWSGGKVTGGRFGMESRRVNASIEHVTFRQQALSGIRAEGGVLSLRDVSLEDGSGSPIFLDGTELSALNLRVSGWPQSGAVMLRSPRLEMRDCSFSRARFGADISGGVADIRDARFEDCGQRALGIDSGAKANVENIVCVGGLDVLVVRDAELDIDGCKASGHAGVAVRAANARLNLKRASFTGGESGILAEQGDCRLTACALVGQSGPASFQNGGRLGIIDSVISGPGTGVRVANGHLVLRAVRFDGPNLAVECAGSAILEDVEHASVAGGVKFGGTSFELSRVNIAGDGGIELTGGRLRWSNGCLRKRGILIAAGGEADMRDVVVRDVAGHGVALRGGTLAAFGCRFEDVAEAAVYVAEGGRAVLKDSSLRRARYGVGVASGDTRLEDVRILDASAVGFTAASGRHELKQVAFHGCADRIHAAENARVEIVLEPSSRGGALASIKRGMRSAVLQTNRLPGLRAVYRAVYVLPVGALRVWSALDGNVDALYAHRSWARRDWEPGLSDIDLLLSVRGLAGERGRSWLERFWRRFGLLKSAFPFLGECLVVEPAELSGHALWGGFRARGVADDLVPMSGGPLVVARRPASIKDFLEPIGELAHAYTRLMAAALWKPDASPAGLLAARNAGLDMARVRAANADDGPAQLPSREAALAAAGAPSSVLHAPLRSLQKDDWFRARAELCAAGLLSLHQASLEVLAAWPRTESSKLRRIEPRAVESAAADVERRRRRGLAGDYASAAGGAIIAGCADDLYRTCLIVEDAAAREETLVGVFEGLSRLISSRGEPATLPIVLTVSGWRVWSRLAYLESPTRFLEPGGGSGDILTAAGTLYPGLWQYAWGREKLLPLESPDALLIDLARESLATARCVWRWQSGDPSPLSRTYIQHYLLGRAMGLRLLLERGIVASFFDLDVLRELYAREFPERAAELERFWLRLTKFEGPAPWSELYVWVDDELRGY